MTTAPPDSVVQDLARLATALDAAIPARAKNNLLVAVEGGNDDELDGFRHVATV